MKERALEEEFRAYADELSKALQHEDRRGPFSEYMRGLVLPLERKSVQPMAAAISPERTSSAHQRMHHFVAKSVWSDEAVLKSVRQWTLPRMTVHEPILAWILDDTGYPKKGEHSVEVARQYSGELGKQDNCQVAVSLSMANERMSVPIDDRLYLPRAWTDDTARKKEAGIPANVEFQTKKEIAMDMIDMALREEIPREIILADAGYGSDTEFRDGLRELEVEYAMGIQKSTTMWAPGTGPLEVPPYGGRGRPPKLHKRDERHRPVGVYVLAMSLPKRLWGHVPWREGARGAMESRFARVRVRAAHRDYWKEELRP